MLFAIDWTKYKCIDLSWTVTANQDNPERPFDVRLGALADGTNKFDIINTHTHVGTHVESPWHFYGKGKTCAEYPVEHFMGVAALLDPVIAGNEPFVRLAQVKKALEPHRGRFDMLYVRNTTAQRPIRYHMECIPYFAEFSLKLFVFDVTVAFGETNEDGRTFHDLLMSRDTLLVEFPDNGHAIDKDLFYLMAVPTKVFGIDSNPCRLLAIVER